MRGDALFRFARRAAEVGGGDEIRMGEKFRRRRIRELRRLLIENVGGRLQVTKLAEYFAQEGKISAHELMDRRFGFGLRWTTGTKD